MNCSCGITSTEKCKEIFDATLAREFGDFQYGRVHRLTIDAYSLQHPHNYMKSSKSYAAHLTGICITMEYGNDKNLLRTLQQWLGGNKQLDRPKDLEYFGNLTIDHIAGAENAEQHISLVHEWAEDAWKAYETYHQIARDWVEIALKEYKGKK